MRAWAWAGGIVAVLVGGLWTGTSVLVQRGAEAWFAGQAARGMVAEKTALGVSGFPGRFDLGITGLRLADPAAGTGWQAPEVHIAAESWRPWRVTANLPDSQTITLPGQSVQVRSQDLTASLFASPALDLPLDQLRVSGAKVQAQSDLGWQVGAEAVSVALTADPEAATRYRLEVQVRDLTPDPALVAALAAVSVPGFPAADFTGQPVQVQAAPVLTFSAPLVLNAEGPPPALVGVKATGATVTWGPLTVTASPDITADAQGFAAGRVDIAITGWDRLPALLVALGAVKPEVGPTIGNMLKAMAAEGGQGDTLALTLDLAEGRMRLGPFPLGPAPRMVAP